MDWLNYPCDADICALRMAENFYLARACENREIMDLQQFFVLRRARLRIAGEGAAALENSADDAAMAEYQRLIALAEVDRRQFMDEVQGHLTNLRNPALLSKPQHLNHCAGIIKLLALKNLGIEKMPKESHCDESCKTNDMACMFIKKSASR